MSRSATNAQAYQRFISMSDCVYGICDGSGFIYDEATNTASDCRCRPQIIARNKARGLSAVVPRLYEDGYVTV